MAWDAPWDLGSVIRELVLFNFSAIGTLSWLFIAQSFIRFYSEMVDFGSDQGRRDG
jgi:hypothetical protein